MAISDKLTYLNTTKTKIREGLNSLGADLDTEDTFRSYADAIEGIYEDYPKITGEGESLSLDNTKQAIMKLDLKGNTSQDGTPTPSSPIPVNVVSGDNTIDICGKNLFDELWQSGNINANSGIEEASTTARRSINYIPVQPNTTYTLSRTIGGNTLPVREYGKDKQYIGAQNPYQGYNSSLVRSYTTSSNVYFIRLVDYVLDETSKIMLEKGSTATTYEPYIGNTYPIYLGVENLFDKDNANILSAYFETGTPTITSNQYNRTFYSPCQPSTTYTLQKIASSNARQVGYTTTLPADGVSVSGIVNMTANTTTITYTTGSDAKYLVFRFYQTTQDSSVTLEQMLNSIQIQKGNQINHTSTTPIELCKIGTYQDYIYKDNGSWYLHKEIGKVVLNGSESWQNAGTNPQKWSLSKSDYKYVEENICFSNYFISTTNGSVGIMTDNQIKFRYHTDQAKWLYICDTSFSAVADFKNWLSTHNTIVYYVLATPTTEEITDATLISQLEALKLATSYESQTNISQENNDLPFILDVKALRGE